MFYNFIKLLKVITQELNKNVIYLYVNLITISDTNVKHHHLCYENLIKFSSITKQKRFFFSLSYSLGICNFQASIEHYLGCLHRHFFRFIHLLFIYLGEAKFWKLRPEFNFDILREMKRLFGEPSENFQGLRTWGWRLKWKLTHDSLVFLSSSIL